MQGHPTVQMPHNMPSASSGPSSRDLFLVTGGTGFLGVAIVRILLDRGYRVRILVRNQDPALAKVPGIDIHIGCVTNMHSVEKACCGTSGVFHLVGIVEHSRASAAHVHRINVEGTRNVVEAAGRHKCKVVFASTSGTVAVSTKGRPVRGDADGYASALIKEWPYYASKEQAEKEARAVAARVGTPLVILRPSSILGPGETSLKAGKSLEYYRNKSVYKHVSRSVPLMPQGGINFVDVRDVAQAFVNAMFTPAADGQAMCLGGDADMTLKDFFIALEEMSGIPRARLQVPHALAWTFIKAVHVLSSAVGKPYHVDPVIVEMANRFWYVDSSLAKKVLGFNPRPWKDTLCETLQYIRDEGHTMGLPKGVPKIEMGGACATAAPRSKL